MWPFKQTREELKPCPFCGERHYVYIMEPDENNGESSWSIGCFAQAEGGCGFSGDFTSRKYAIDAWNKRS